MRDRARVSALLLFILSLISPFEGASGRITLAHQKQQKPGESQGVLRLETFLVQLDTTVTDKKGNLVRGLKREDFEVYEDGIKQPVTHFSIRTAPREVALAAGDSKAGFPARPAVTASNTSLKKRYLLFAVDDLHLSPLNLPAVKKALLKFVDEQMTGGDRVAIVTTSGSLGFLQQFTYDRDVLRHAIAQLSARPRRAFQSYEVPRITDYQAELIEGGDEDALEIAVEQVLKLEPKPARPNARARAIQESRAKARMIVAQNSSVTTSTFDSLEQIVRSLGSLPGRKVFVLLSDGFLLGGPRNPREVDLHRITDAATQSGVMIYSIDSRGLTGPIAGGDASEESGFTATDTNRPGVLESIAMRSVGARRDGLSALALDTGGFLVQESDNFAGAIQRVIDDNATYYLLGYEPDLSTRRGNFRKISVRISGHPDYRVRTRTGYFAPGDLASQKSAASESAASPENSDEETKVVSDTRMREALGALVPIEGIPVGLVAEFVATPKAETLAVITSGIDMRLLSFQREGEDYVDKIELVTLAYDEHGKLAGSFGEHLGITIPATEFQHAVENSLNHKQPVTLKPGLYQIRVAAREESTGRIGSASCWVEIPDLTNHRLALSSIVLIPEGAAESANPKAAGGAAAPVARRERPERIFRKFHGSDHLDLFAEIYNAYANGSGQISIRKLIYSGSKLLNVSPFSPVSTAGLQEGQPIPYAFRLSLSPFPPGQYELRLEVSDSASKRSLFRSLYFAVE